MSISSNIIKKMQSDEAFMETQRSGARRVKLERGQNWIVRFLPARMGPDGLWYARIARHWMNRLPIVCPRCTAADFGGDPDRECPVCLLADELNGSPDEAISKFGYKAKANSQFLTYCVVFEKDGVEQPMSEVLNPYEFWHYRSTWEELKGFYLAGGRKSPDSVFDYEKGNDFSVNKTAKGLRLDKQDSTTIFDTSNPKYADWIKKLESAMKTPKVVIPKLDQLQTFADKLHELANRSGGFDEDEDMPRASRRAGRSRQDEDDEDMPRASSRRAQPDVDDDSSLRSGRAGRSRQNEDDEDEDLRSARRAQSESAGKHSMRGKVEDEDEDDLSYEPSSKSNESTPRSAPKPVSRRDEGDNDDEAHDPDPDPKNEPPDEVPAPRGRLETDRQKRERVKPEHGEDEDDTLPEDDKDDLPAAEKPSTKKPENDEDDGTALPKVSRRGGLGADIKARISKLRERE